MRIGSGLKSKTRLCRHFVRNACEARLQGASLEASLHLNIPRFKSTESGKLDGRYYMSRLGQRMTKRESPIRTGKCLKPTIQTP